jgi:hypothetical protein
MYILSDKKSQKSTSHKHQIRHEKTDKANTKQPIIHVCISFTNRPNRKVYIVADYKKGNIKG